MTATGLEPRTLSLKTNTQRLIQEPTHILSNLSCCIDLVFMSQHKLLMESGVHSLLHENCHHQLVYPKFNLKVWYPAPYERKIWHYQYANIDQIKEQLNSLLGKNHLKSSR